MSVIGLAFIVFGVIVIVFPDIIAYIIGGLFLFFGLNMIFFRYLFFRKIKKSGESYIKFGSYRIYRD